MMVRNRVISYKVVPLRLVLNRVVPLRSIPDSNIGG